MARTIILYARISTDLQSLDNQISTLTEFVGNRFPDAKYEIVKEIGSGGKDSRPEYQGILKKVRAGLVSHVIICKLDRWSRSLKDLLNSIHTLEQNNTKLISIKDDIDLSSPTGMLVVQMLGSIAEFERSLIVARVREGMSKAKSKGVHCGRKRLIVNRDEVRKLKAQGQSVRQIGKALKVSPSSVQKILKAS